MTTLEFAEKELRKCQMALRNSCHKPNASYEEISNIRYKIGHWTAIISLLKNTEDDMK